MNETTLFGDCISFHHNGEFIENNLSRMIKKNKFSGYSAKGITSYLSFRHPIGSLTMFEDFFKVPFGTKCVDGKISKVWHPRFTNSEDSIEEAILTVEKKLLKSIAELTKESDNLCATISGGVDSSLIVAMLRKLYPEREINTYCVGFYGDDEFEYAKKVASANKTIHKEILLQKDDFLGSKSILPDLIEFKAAPLHPNELPLALAEKVARSEGMDIVLCGEGSDDIFGGYGHNLRMYLNYDYSESFLTYFLSNYRYFTLEDRNIIQDDFLVNDFDLLLGNLSVQEIPFDIRNIAFYFIQKIHTPGLITRGANALRFNGFPMGFPFINYDLIEYVNSLPFEYKVKWKSQKDKVNAKGKRYYELSETHDIPKYLIKKVAEKYLDDEIIYRPKKGFPVPFNSWFKDLDRWDFNHRIFKSNDLRKYSGWKKFMLINLDLFTKIFDNYNEKR